MKKTYTPDLSSLLLRAHESEVGIAVVTDSPLLLRNKLYPLRKQLNLLHLTFVQPPVDTDTRLWILKKEARHGTD